MIFITFFACATLVCFWELKVCLSPGYFFLFLSSSQYKWDDGRQYVNKEMIDLKEKVKPSMQSRVVHIHFYERGWYVAHHCNVGGILPRIN